MFLCLLLTLLVIAGASHASINQEDTSSFPALTFKLYDNAALAGTPALQGQTLAAELSLEEQDPEGNEAPCHLSGELLGTVAFAKPSGVYQFNCTFSDTSTGFVWIDGHLVCNDGNAYRQKWDENPPDNPLPIARPLPFRVHITSNDTSCAKPASVKVSWREITHDDDTQEFQLLTSNQAVTLSPGLPPAEDQRDAFQRNLGHGWGAWLRHDPMSLVKLPEGLVLTPRLCRISNNTCHRVLDPTLPEMRVGLHAYDRSYVAYSVAFGGDDLNVTVEYSVRDKDQLYFLVTPTVLPSNSSDYELRLSGRYAWYRPGDVAVANGNQLTFATPGMGVDTITLATDDTIGTAVQRRRRLQEEHDDDDPYLSLPLSHHRPIGFGANLAEAPSVTEIAVRVNTARQAEESRIQNEFGRSKFAVAEAIQSAVMWTLIYNPLENHGLLMPVSRGDSWSFEGQSGAANTDWYYIIFDWDNIFASLLAGLDNKDIAYSNLFQVIKSKTAAGFVPNFATGGFKTQDRTEPTIGAKVLLELYKKHKDRWVVEVLFDDLVDWNDWVLDHRILQPEGLVALGSHSAQYLDPSRPPPGGTDGVGPAVLESGMDNSPMYDGASFDPTTHLLQVYDVGMSSLFVQEAYSLARLATVIGRHDHAKQLQERGDAMKQKIQSCLWDETQQVFANRYPNGTFSDRISPTSFYPLLVGAASDDQAESMAVHWLLNASRFCLSPTGDFDGNDPDGCYYGLPSISADDPSFMKKGESHYWRGYVWGPLSQLVYWSLQEHDSTSVLVARRALCQQMEVLMLSQWNAHRHICENFHPSLGGNEDCTGTKFYHWGALNGLIGMMEDGHW